MMSSIIRKVCLSVAMVIATSGQLWAIDGQIISESSVATLCWDTRLDAPRKFNFDTAVFPVQCRLNGANEGRLYVNGELIWSGSADGSVDWKPVELKRYELSYGIYDGDTPIGGVTRAVFEPSDSPERLGQGSGAFVDVDASVFGSLYFDTREISPRPSSGMEGLSYSQLWDGDAEASVAIAQDGAVIADGLTGEGVQEWKVARGGRYDLTHTTYTNGVAGEVLAAAFQVPDQPIPADEVTVEAYEGMYDGKGHGLGVSGPEGAVFRFAMAQGGPFLETLLFTNVCDVTVWYEVSGEGYLSLTNSSTVKIAPKSIEGATVILGDPLAYTGEEQRQTISQVTVDGLDVTYTVEGDSATEKGEHSMTLTGTGNFEGTVEKAYAIQDVAVSARQRYPWNGLVDLKFTVTGTAGTTFDVAFTAMDEIGGTNVPMKTLIREDGSAASSTAAVSPGTYRWAWNAAADLPKGWTCRSVSISADANVRTYIVRFNANGGTGTMQDEKFTYGFAQPLTANAFKRDGYVFDGWAKSSTGARVYSDKQSVLNLTATANGVCNLYARWKEVPTSLYLVLDLSGGPSAKSYAKTSLDAAPSGGWNDDYRKTKLVLRRIEPGIFVHNDTFGGHKGTIQLTSPYYIGVFEVTQRQYELVMGVNPSYYSGDMRPVESVSWNDLRGDVSVYNWPGETKVDASTFIGKIRAKTGLEFDLPTKAEWENACRAGTTTEYCCGSSGDVLMKYARHSFNRDDVKGGYSEHTKVGSYLPNAWGLYDMHGNVRELCVNWSYAVTDATDPIGPLNGTYKVICNGDYSSGLTEMGSSFCASGLPDRRSAGTGFRLSLPLR